jgi:hypothetical protein
MARCRQPLLRSYEADIQLLIASIDRRQFQTVIAAAKAFNVPRTTLHDRCAGRPARRDCQPNSRKLTQIEAEVIVRHILDLDHCRFAPTYAAVRDMADRLLAACGGGQVGQKWPSNFVKRTDSLKTRFNRA